DKLDKFGPDGVRLLLGKGRLDESGDFTKGAGLDDAQAARVMSVVERQAGSAGDDIAAIAEASVTAKAGFSELDEIEALVRAAGYGPDRIKIDPSVVRGLEYYTGPVYEAELLAEIPNDEGQIVRFGSVGGGG
ncbi:histidine--tRNA ligase, partial [Rhizobiaceae sp. 2RAB30]